MDTEKYLDIEKKIRAGQSPSDEGPFYHHSWWESYKGSIKGKLGGAIIGGLIGAVVGTIAFLIGGLGPAAFAAFIGGGLIYGMHEFSDIGKVAGGLGGALEQSDAREAIRFSALEKRIDGLAEIVGGDKAKGRKMIAEADAETEELETYRTTHYAKMNGSTKGMVFGKIALIGLLVGAAAGAILGVSGASTHILEAIGVKVAEGATITAMSAVTFGLFGASFGISRDIFRKVFDVTDLWSKGIFTHAKVQEHQVKAGLEIEKEMNGEKEEPRVTHSGHAIDYPQSDTFHRDRLLAQAEKALMNFDHTRATPQ